MNTFQKSKQKASLLPQGEGQDEGVQKQMVADRYPLSPTLSTLVPNFVLPPPSLESSLGEREFTGQQ
jgi:hypothetical protein